MAYVRNLRHKLNIKMEDLNKELIKKQYKEWVEQVSEDLPDKSFFSIDEVVTKVIELVEQAINNDTLYIVSTCEFNKECYIDVDKDTDEYVLIHKGVIKKRSKSRFDCLLMKKRIQKSLGV